MRMSSNKQNLYLNFVPLKKKSHTKAFQMEVPIGAQDLFLLCLVVIKKRKKNFFTIVNIK